MREQERKCSVCGEEFDSYFRYENELYCKEHAEYAMNDWFEELPFGDKLQVFQWEYDDFETLEGAEDAASVQWYRNTSFQEKLDILRDYGEDIQEVY